LRHEGRASVCLPNSSFQCHHGTNWIAGKNYRGLASASASRLRLFLLAR
jgi:hypothetical protein